MHHDSDAKLAASATLHCLLGCGIGEVFGVVVGTALGLSFYVSLGIGVIAGFIFEYLLGILPLLRLVGVYVMRPVPTTPNSPPDDRTSCQLLGLILFELVENYHPLLHR